MRTCSNPPQAAFGIFAADTRREAPPRDPNRISGFLRRSRPPPVYSPVAKDSRPTGSKIARAEAMEKGPRTCLGQ